MTLWKSFGASVIGPGHIREGKPNQDAWKAFHNTWGDGVIVSDGLGSKTYSDFGSSAACRAVTCAVYACRDKKEIDQTFLYDKIKSNWLSFIAPLESRDCSATCLFAFRLSDGLIRTGMLGDGLIAVLKNDDTVLSLAEDKANGFSNITSALSEKTTDKEWRFQTLQEELCRAVLLCTDGVSDDLTDTDAFIRGFITHAVDSACVSASRNTRIMLEDWPVPKHSDDKTIACLFRREPEDE
ncbi:MAG: protein phosphatase 2C domain-containing protein [Treponema sp.]|jgi:serine/threonine protein phosphatase PrpC|nr:protein phosphatase 2C domain-containing protein [Treponema sp.]